MLFYEFYLFAIFLELFLIFSSFCCFGHAPTRRRCGDGGGQKVATAATTARRTSAAATAAKKTAIRK
jgi:hypothetical protein